MITFFRKYKMLILYGAILSVLLLLLKWLEFRFLILHNSIDIYIGLIALIFTLLGIWLAQKLASPKVRIVEKEVYVNKAQNFVPDESTVEKMGLSKRELEVLTLMAEGWSNQEIAEKLFVSLNTIKTHASRIFEKMDVKRRTQAIEKAQKSGLIP